MNTPMFNIIDPKTELQKDIRNLIHEQLKTSLYCLSDVLDCISEVFSCSCIKFRISICNSVLGSIILNIGVFIVLFQMLHNSCTRHVLMCFVLSCKNTYVNLVKGHIFFII